MADIALGSLLRRILADNARLDRTAAAASGRRAFVVMAICFM
jgi:hypothetical protein